MGKKTKKTKQTKKTEQMPMTEEDFFCGDPDKARMCARQQNQSAWEYARKSNVKTILGIGYVFAPSEQLLIKYYLERKYLGSALVYCPIEVVDDLYSCHPQDLADIAGKSGIWYFFTTSRPNEIQPNGKVQGEWTSGDMNIVFDQNQKVGCKQVYEYCEGDHKGKYKMIEYQLDPAPVNDMDRPWFEYCEEEGVRKIIKYDDSAPVKCPWFVCQLCKDDGSGRDVQH